MRRNAASTPPTTAAAFEIVFPTPTSPSPLPLITHPIPHSPPSLPPQPLHNPHHPRSKLRSPRYHILHEPLNLPIPPLLHQFRRPAALPRVPQTPVVAFLLDVRREGVRVCAGGGTARGERVEEVGGLPEVVGLVRAGVGVPGGEEGEGEGCEGYGGELWLC